MQQMCSGTKCSSLAKTREIMTLPTGKEGVPHMTLYYLKIGRIIPFLNAFLFILDKKSLCLPLE